MKLLTVLGARPQFIKAAAVSRAINSFDEIEEVIVHTGQHYDANMSDIFFSELEIPKPNYNLDINGVGHGAMTGRMMEAIEEVLIKENPDALMVFGDTNSTIAGALAAAKLHVKVIHVEAGLRSFNMEMPEEINRILTDRISNLLFCPTDNAIENLKKEGFENFDCQIVLNGDVMKDAALFYKKKSDENATVLKKHKVQSEYILATCHRAENTDDKNNLTNIIKALNEINEKTQVIMPLHPRTKARLESFGLVPEFKTIEPVGYLDMVQLISNANLVMTDSGGLQKEAYFFEKYCITMREQTEWVELVDNGYNRLVGTDSVEILNAFKFFREKSFEQKSILYGNGDASMQICKTLIKAEW